jgi:ribosomal-protein-serine acetyltransferase
MNDLRIAVVSEGVHGRLLRYKDADDLFAFMESNREYLLRWVATPNYFRSLADTQEVLKRYETNLEAGKQVKFGLWREKSLIGHIGLNAIDQNDKSASLGYLVAGNEEGKGIATKGCGIMVKFAFEQLKLHRLQIQCQPDNKASVRIAEKLGFQFEGVCREAYCLHGRFVDINQYSLLEQECRSQ